MKTTLITVNYNGGSEVVQDLQRISEQVAGEATEIVVVDNGSTDGSGERIRRDVPGVRLVIEPENRGYASGVNRGLREASGDILIVLNPDVRPHRGAVAILANAALAHPEITLLGGMLVDSSQRIDGNCARPIPGPMDILREGFFLPHRKAAWRRRLRQSEDDTVEVEVVSGAVIAVLRENLEKLGAMDTEYFLYNEDVEWCLRARKLGGRVEVAPNAVFEHDGGASTRRREGPAFAARVLADFQFFCEEEKKSAEKIRRLWRIRTRFRALLYGLDARLGILGRRKSSKKRAAIYRLLHSELKRFRWSPCPSIQNGHPSRLIELPGPCVLGPKDSRPVVLQVVPDMGYGGTQRVIEALIRSSLSREHRFEILCLTHPGEIGERLREEGHRIFVAGLSGWRSLAGWKRAADYAALLEPDLVHSHLLPGDIAAYVGFRRRAPWISTKHSIDSWMSRTERLLERYVLRDASQVLAVGDTVARAKAYLGRSGTLPVVVPNPVVVPISSSPAPLFPTGQPIRLGILGRLHPVKRVDLFLHMAARLERNFPSRFSFRIVGDGPERSALQHLASELELDARVELRGATDDIAEELDELDLTLLFSEAEGLALTVLETLARGRIPVVRRAGGASEALPPFLEDCLVDSSSPEAFEEKVLEICDEPDRFAPLIGKAREWLARRPCGFDMTRRAYQEALGRSGDRTKILHIITRLIVGGAQENAIASVERVDPDRFDSQLWMGPQAGAEGSLLDEARRRGIAPRILPNLVRQIHPWKDLLVTLQLARLLRRERFDIVHTHSSKAGIVGRLAAKIAGVSHIVHTVHGWGFHEHMNSALRRVYVILERVMARWTRPLVSVSDHTTRVGLDQRIGATESYRLIRSGIPLTEFHPDPGRRSAIRKMLKISDEEIVIGSVGRLSPQKNPLDFIRAATLLLERHQNVRFIYVGDGSLRSTVERTIREAGVQEKILLLGLRDDVADLLRAMDLFLLTSLWEGLPRVIPQALATGVPVVAYDTGGMEESVREGRNGYLVRPSAVEDLVERLTRLIEDDSLRSGMAHRAVAEFDDSFSEDAMIRDLQELYEETAGSPRGPGIRRSP